MMAHRRFRLVDLFAGCGGMTQGFVATRRYDPVFAVEVDESAAATYVANFGDHVARDVTDPKKRPLKIEEVEHFPEAPDPNTAKTAVANYDIRNRTQDVAGSSPASSIEEVRRNGCRFQIVN